MASIRVTSDTGGDPYFHFPGVLPTNNTLCGWTDVDTEESRRAPDCPSCFRVIAFCKSVRIRRPAKVKNPAEMANPDDSMKCERCRREVDEDREVAMCCDDEAACQFNYLCPNCFNNHDCAGAGSGDNNPSQEVAVSSLNESGSAAALSGGGEGRNETQS